MQSGESSHLIPENFNFNPSGPIDPLFVFPDFIKMGDLSPFQPLSEAKRHRLVKASKSPTTEQSLENELELGFKKAQFFLNTEKAKHCSPEFEREPVEHDHARIRTPDGAMGCKTVIEFREWQEAWRIRTEVEAASGSLPPSQEGLRTSEMLTARGATKIGESCEYMHLRKGGFKTFVTGTFSEEVREKIELGETSIQKEVTRTMDGLQKMYQRGWSTKGGERVEGHSEGLPYLWVVEIPDNEDGKPNPHVHLLLGWRVAYRHFEAWAERIEGLWGNGYFHLEKIKDSECAGAYMAKAAGYLCKAQEKNDQGIVKGNRYGISKTARAPAWEIVSTGQLGAMTQVIYDVYDHLTVKYGEKYRTRKKLNEQLANTHKDAKQLRKIVGEKLMKVRTEIKKIPIRCNKYQIVITGKSAAMSFFNWLKNPEGETSVREEWLPEKMEGWHWESGDKPHARDSQFHTKLRKRFEQRRFWRRLRVPKWMKELSENYDFWKVARSEYEVDCHIEMEREEQRGEAWNLYLGCVG